MKKLPRGYRGDAARWLQEALNKRSKARGLPLVKVDGVIGNETLQAVQRIGRALGALESTLRKARADKAVSVGLQRMIRWPATRTPAQFVRAKSRKNAKQKDALRLRAYDEAARLVGIMEEGGNNVGREVSALIREGGGVPGQAWCGWFCAVVYKRAGSSAVSWHWGAVRLYLPLPGLKRVSKPLKGNLVRFNFDHIGVFVRDLGNGYIETIEGNTGATGAVSDSATGGDGVYRKRRHKSLVRDYVHVTR